MADSGFVNLVYNNVSKSLALKSLSNENIALLFELKPEHIVLINSNNRTFVPNAEPEALKDIGIGEMLQVLGHPKHDAPPPCAQHYFNPVYGNGNASYNAHENPSVPRINKSNETAADAVAVSEKCCVQMIIAKNYRCPSQKDILDDFKIFLHANECTINFVTIKLIEKRPVEDGYEYIIYSSLGRMIYDCDATRTTLFWKDRKFYATTIPVVEPKKSEPELFSKDGITKLFDAEMDAKCIARLKSIDGVSGLMDTVGVYLECTICHFIVTKPWFCQSCQRLIGCDSCVTRWFEENNAHCPVCRGSKYDHYQNMSIYPLSGFEKSGVLLRKFNALLEKLDE